MDSINSNPPFNPARINSIYSIQNSAHSAKPSSHVSSQAMQPQAVTKIEKVETFSKMFDDQELDRLQKNLESIAFLAETALKRFKPENN